MPWVSESKANVIPLGVNEDKLKKHKNLKKKENSILYASSPDRGLLSLLRDWSKLKDKGYSLNVAYSFDILNKIAEQNPNIQQQVDELYELMKQDGIEYLGSLNENNINKQYAKSEYWILPLQLPESELFCLNAVKSRYFGCKSIVNLRGALKETVGDYIDYSDFLTKGTKEVVRHEPTFSAQDWSEVVKEYWIKLLGEK